MENNTSEVNPQAFAGALRRTPRFYKQWMLAGNPAYYFDRLVKDFGDFVHYRGLFSFYLVNHPALVKQVLQDTNKTFNKKSVIYDRFRNAFGNGLVVAEGDRWKRQRKLMQPMFGPTAVKRFFDLMVMSTTEVIKRWEGSCRSQNVFNIAHDMNQLTLTIAGRAMFNDSFDEAAAKISHWTHVINRYSAKPPLPIIRSIWFPSRTNAQLKETLRQFYAFLQEMIDARRLGIPQKDLLGVLLDAKHEESGISMSDHEIAEEILGMIVGGHETSSSALTWVWYELDRNPDVERRLHQELDAVIGDRSLTIDDLPKLVYTKMIVDETLRLHPPFWFENRNVACDVQLGGSTIPKGSLVVFSRYSLHRHPSFWREPDRFIPCRFEPDHEENKRSLHACVPFGGGPRICIGINFAVMELLVVLATITRRYKVIVDSCDRHEMAAHLTMTPRHGVQVRLLERNAVTRADMP